MTSPRPREPRHELRSTIDDHGLKLQLPRSRDGAPGVARGATLAGIHGRPGLDRAAHLTGAMTLPLAPRRREGAGQYSCSAGRISTSLIATRSGWATAYAIRFAMSSALKGWIEW